MSANGNASNGAQLTLDVTIFGREYKIACNENERAELVEAVAYLDRKMRELIAQLWTAVDSLQPIRERT